MFPRLQPINTRFSVRASPAAHSSSVRCVNWLPVLGEHNTPYRKFGTYSIPNLSVYLPSLGSANLLIYMNLQYPERRNLNTLRPQR